MTDQPNVTLYTYFRSSCSARLRIALDYKSIPFTSIYINLLKGEQHSAPYNTTINPSSAVPSLIIKPGAGAGTTDTVTITQSMAALEYLEEAFPDKPALLPPASDPAGRAHVRTLASIIACDVQPVTNLRILKRVGALGVDRTEWSKDLVVEGLAAYEALASKTAGKFSVGDQLTLADLCLLPAVWGAERIGLGLEDYPTVKRIAETLEGEDCVKRGHWRTQEDTPEEFRLT